MAPIRNQGKIYYRNGQIGYIARPYAYFTKGMLNAIYTSDESEKGNDEWVSNAENDPNRYKQVVKIELIYNNDYPVTHFAEQVFTNQDSKYYLSRVSTYMPNLKEIKIGEGFENFERGRCFMGLGYVEKIDLPSTFVSVGGIENGDHFMIDMANLKTLILRNPVPPKFYDASGNEITPEDSFKRLGHAVVYVPDAAVETYKSNPVFTDLDIRPLSEYQESDAKTVFLEKIKGKFELNGNKLGKFYINGVEYNTPNITGVKKNYINFKDTEVERICIENFSSDGIGVTYEDAASVTDLGRVFSGNTAITSFDELQYFTGLQGINDFAFHNCTSLISIKLPDSVTSVGQHAFNWCTSLSSITLSNSLISIGYAAFLNCTSLQSINIPDGVTSISNYAFQSCSSLTSINIPSGVTNINDYAISYCRSLQSINIPSGVTSIGDGAFTWCTSLLSINIPSGVTAIGDYAFNYCSNLSSITSNATIAPTITNSTFQNLPTGGTLFVPANATGYDVWMGTGNYYLGKYNWTLSTL